MFWECFSVISSEVQHLPYSCGCSPLSPSFVCDYIASSCTLMGIRTLSEGCLTLTVTVTIPHRGSGQNGLRGMHSSVHVHILVCTHVHTVWFCPKHFVCPKHPALIEIWVCQTASSCSYLISYPPLTFPLSLSLHLSMPVQAHTLLCFGASNKQLKNWTTECKWD